MKIRPTLFLAAALAVFAGGLAFADDKPVPSTEKKWKNETEVSVVSANGNTRSTTSSGKNTFTYNWTHTSLELIGSALGARNQGTVTAEKYDASEKGTYKLTDRNYTYEKFAWNKDRFAGFRDRYDSSVGLGRQLVKMSRDSLILELGAGYVKEDRLKAENQNYTSGRAYSKYEHALSATSSFTQDVEYLHDFDRPSNFRVNTETALTAALSAHFSLKTSYKWQHVDSPPPGFGRNDTLFTVSLLAVY